MNSVRLWYKKSGLAVYTSHLDMNRCFTRAVRRAEIPIWYTEGFNPHPYMTFLLPLPLGQEGIKEPVDIRTVDDISKEEIKERLNAVLPESLEIVEVTDCVNKVNTITDARYEIIMSFENEGEATGFVSGAKSVIEGGVLEAEKRSKRGIIKINLCEFITAFEIADTGNEVKIDTVLNTGTEKNLNPALLAQALCGEYAASPIKLNISRTVIYMNNLEIFE